MRNYLLLIATLLLSSCVQDATEGVVDIAGGNESVATKLVFTSEHAERGELLVCFEDDAIAQIEASVSRSENTRSGIESFDAVLERIGVRSMERLFPVDVRHEERKRAAGLHRWYVVEFEEESDLDAAALAMAEVAEVRLVEFNQKLKSVHDGNFIPLSENTVAAPASSTRAVTYQFNDTYLPKQWHYINTGDTSVYSGAKAGADVNCEEAWKLCTGDPSIIVAIVDNCVQWDHPDLAANMWVNPRESSGASGVDDDGNGYVDDIHGYNFYSDTALQISTSGNAPEHGTHVAGTVAAVNNNGTGVCGIAGGSGKNDGVKLMSCQIFHNSNGTDGRITSQAIAYAADNGASIIQCSYGYEAGSYTSDAQYAVRDSAEKEAIDYFIKTKNNDVLDGGLAIFAAGNDMRGMSSYPAAYRDYISVTAMSCDYTPAYYTNYGPGCNVAAPGGDAYQNYWDTGNIADAPNMPSSQVLSTVLNGGYGYAQGTSMACPHMSGVAALGLSYAHRLGKHFTVDEFKALLLTSVNEIDRYCTGTKDYVTQSATRATLNLAPYKGKMGTGCIDAYQVLMNIEGTPCVPVRVGTKQAVDITNIVGKGASGMTFLGIEISEADKAKVGLEGSVSVSSSGKLSIKCTKAGSARVKIRFIAGGNTAGTDTTMGGMELSKEFVIVARGFSRNDGWL